MMKKNNIITIVAATTTFLSFSASATEISTNAALMQAMDKVTGRVNKIIVPVKGQTTFGDFSLVLRDCKKRPAEETPENFAFIDVTDKSFGAEEYNIFRGWIISSTPGINAIEHPIYDVWLLECIDTKVDKKELLSDETLAQRDSLPTKSIFAAQKTETEETPEVKTSPDTEPKAIHIKEFIQEDKVAEKPIEKAPSYISEISSGYVSDIEEGEEPENLLLFTKMQEVNSEKSTSATDDNDLTEAINAEMKALHDSKQ